MNIKKFFGKRSGSFLMAIGFALVALIGIFDYLTGPYFSSIILYLAPVILVTWFVGRSAGILTSIASAVSWLAAAVASSPLHHNIIIHFWNLTEKLGIFLIVVYILLELKKEEEASRKLERERRTMISMFAHDMKNPVIITKGFLSRLRSGKAGPLNERQINYMELMDDELDKLEGFILDFLEFSMFDSKKYKPVPVPFDMAIAMRKHIEAARIEADKKDIEIFFEIPEDMTAVVNADVVQIDRVIANLLDNAIKYTKPGGTVTVKLLNKGKNILVQVIDTGIGIQEEHIPHIFDAFYRANRDSKGSGLGLSIVKKIVEANGGRIWVESIHGKGSTFSFTIPGYHRNEGRYKGGFLNA